MMFYPIKTNLLLALALLLLEPLSTLGAKSATTKNFKFTDDFYLKFQPLSTAISPDNVDVLQSALDDFAEQFKAAWMEQILNTLQAGECIVNQMQLPEFSLSGWKYPDKYDVDELPIPGQCYQYESGFVQRVYYKIQDLEISCPEDFDYDDLDKDAYTAAAFDGSEFFQLINPPDSDCTGTTDCLFSTAESAVTSSSDACTAELYINRFINVPIYLKCLNYADGYGTNIANKLIKALDKFFELEVLPVLSLSIMDQVPKGFVYNFASPYASDRNYCGHGSYYAGGSLVHQVPCSDGILLTQFYYGFDVIWYKPRDFNGTLFENEDIPAIINTVFEEADFLSFIKQQYPDYDFIQDINECDVIDPAQCNVTFAPTEAFTFPPTSAPIIPIIESSQPTSSAPTLVSLLTFSPSSTPLTSTPSGEQTPIPSLRQPTMYPTFGSTDDEGLPTSSTPSPTCPKCTKPPTPPPTCPGCIIYPDDLEEDECPIVTTGTCGGGVRGDGICPFAGYCCSKWGYCGTTAEYCEDDSVAPAPSPVDGSPTAPTYSVEAGQCAKGEVGDDFCPDENHCCSEYGYCGSGEQYCYTTTINEGDCDGGCDEEIGTCGGGGIGNGICSDGLCCSKYGFCGEGELYCTGETDDMQETGGTVDEPDDGNESESAVDGSPLPDGLKPEFGFRCGYTEVDARSNCKPECTHANQCSEGEGCWGIQLNYCNAFEEGEHPVCTDLDIADTDSRCGYDEAAARGYCGPKCTSDGDCGSGEFCFPTLLNLCECHEETNAQESTVVFARAKSLISSYSVNVESKNSKAQNSSPALQSSIWLFVGLLSLASIILISG